MRTTESTESGSEGFRDTVMRYLAMAQAVPMEPLRRTTQQIADRLRDEGFKCNKRTVERDLVKLSSVFRYEWDTQGRANFWYYPREARLFEIPGMSTACALALAMSHDYLRPLLPPAMLDLAKPYFQRAETVLEEGVSTRYSAWRKRIRVITPGPGLGSPRVLPAVQIAVYDAALCGKQVDVDYASRGATAASRMTLHPQGLVVRDGVIYLVATAWDYEDLRHYALHRIKRAVLCEAPARAVPELDFGAYVEREFRYPVSPGMLRMQLRADSAVSMHLEERPLSAGQAMSADGDHRIITATVADTDELRWWLLGFGSQIEVLKPRALRNEMARTAAQMSALYAKPAGKTGGAENGRDRA